MRFMYEMDGMAVICFAAPKESLERVLGPLTDEAYMAHVFERSIPKEAGDVIFLSDDWTPPTSREFRDAWAIRGTRIEVDMPKARGIHRDRLRRERAHLLLRMDVEELRADEITDTKERDDTVRKIRIRRQKLRDVPQHPKIDAASTPEELSALTLNELVAA